MTSYPFSPLLRRHFVKTLTLLFIVSTLLVSSNIAFAADGVEKPGTEAVSAILFDARRGQVIISKAPDEISHSPLANRIMTVLVAVEKADIESMVTASKDAVNTDGATLKMAVGEKYALKNLLYAFLLTGSPDAAKAIAEYVGGSETGFVSMMNEFAAKLNMKNTRFVNSNGDYSEYQYSTAEDILILMKYALANTNFNRFFSTQAKPWYDQSKTLLLTNTNNMFWNYQGTDGGATANIDTEFQSIVTTATKNNMRLVCVLLDVPTKSMYTDSINLLNYGFDNFLYGTLVSAGSSQRTITVDGQILNLVPISDVYYIYPKGENYIKDVAINVDETKLKPPITKNNMVGMLTFTLADETVINVELYPDREILPQKTKSQIIKDRIAESRELIYVILGLIVLEIIIGAYKLFSYIKKKMIKVQVKKLRRR